MVVAGVAIDDIEVLYFVEVVLGGIGGEDAGHTRVKAAAEDGRQAGLLKALAVGPLPAVLEVCHVLGLVVSRIKIVDTALQTGFHDGKVLIGQGQVHHQFGLEVFEEGHQFVHVVGINLCRADARITDTLYDGIAL